MAVVATLPLASSIPAKAVGGSIPGTLYHGTVTAAGGAGTYLVTHGLNYSPTFAMAIAVLADGTTPTASNAVSARVSADDTATAFGIALPANGTYEVIFG